MVKKIKPFFRSVDEGAIADFQKKRFLKITQRIFLCVLIGFVLLSVCLNIFAAPEKVITVFYNTRFFIAKYKIPILILYLTPFIIGSLTFLLKFGMFSIMFISVLLSKLLGFLMLVSHLVSFIVAAILFIPFLFIECLIAFPRRLFLRVKSVLTPSSKLDYVGEMNFTYRYLGLTFITIIALLYVSGIDLQGTVHKSLSIAFIVLCLHPLIVSLFVMISRILGIKNSVRFVPMVLIALIPLGYIFFNKNPLLLILGFIVVDYSLRRLK